jgi:flagellar FliJ protein
VFKLQNMLSLKEKFEKRAKLEFGAAMAELEREKRQCERLSVLRENSVQTFRDKARSGVKPDEAIRYNMYLAFIKTKIDEQNVKIARAEAKAEKKRRALIEASKERKSLEKLREKAYALYTLEERKAEQRIIDEQISYRFR